MEIDLKDISEKKGLRDFMENPIDVADVLLVVMSLLLISGVVNSSNYGITDGFALFVNFLSFILVFIGGFLVLSDIDKERYMKAVAVIFLLVILLSSVSASGGAHPPNSDIEAFSVYSANLTLQGENPYTKSMLPSLEMFEDVERGTPLMEGGYVDSLSYPSLSFLFLVPQVAAGYQSLFFSTLPFAILTALFIILVSKPRYSLLGGIAFYLLSSKIGVSSVEYTWLSMFLIGIWLWEPKRYLSLFFIGISFAFKQIPWFVAPFLAIWIIKENNDLKSGFIEILKQLGFLGGVFALPNLPFIAGSPVNWVQGVFTPLSSTGTLVQRGPGFSQLSLSLEYLPNSFFNIVMLTFFICSLIIYWLYFDEIKWSAWIMPSIILWFNYRVFDKYIMVMIPIVVLVFIIKENKTMEISPNNLKESFYG